MHILVVEDDLRMLELLRKGLSESGFEVTTAADGDSGLSLALAHRFDAIVLDIGLPGRSGYSITAHLRKHSKPPAIVMLTALNKEDHIVCGLDAGADDYITKPFSFPELIARIHSVARRIRIASADHFSFGPFRIDAASRRLFCDDIQIHVTRSEYLLLRALALHRGEVVSRRQLMQAVWGSTISSSGALDTLVNTLREKLNTGQPDPIRTVRGSGYTLVDDLEPVRTPAP
ncbi:MAG: response regulator transcription factor [Terracidiphilus sp.]